MKRTKGPRIRYGRKFDCGLVGKSIEEIQKIIEEKTAFFAAEKASQAAQDGIIVDNDDDEFKDDFSSASADPQVNFKADKDKNSADNPL